VRELARAGDVLQKLPTVKYKLVIFDFDGTLADSASWLLTVINQVAKRYRFRSVTQGEFEMLRGKDTRAILAHLGVSTWKLPFIARHMRQLVARDAHLIGTFAGVHELLARLDSAGVVIAVVSSNSEANVRAILGARSAGLIRFYACGAGLFGKRKKFRSVLQQSGFAATEVLAIGDEVRDIEAAMSEGIAAGGVSWGYATLELLKAHTPTLLFESVDEMQQALLPSS
jgi:phosphoglycolate phosphatase